MFCVLNKIKIISLSYLLLKLFTIKIVTVSCDTLYIIDILRLNKIYSYLNKSYAGFKPEIKLLSNTIQIHVCCNF